MNRRSSDSIAHNRLLQEMHDQAGDGVRVRVQCKYNGSWEEYDGIISYQPTGYKANYKVEFDWGRRSIHQVPTCEWFGRPQNTRDR